MWIHQEKNKPGMMIDIGAGDPSCGEVQAGGEYVLQDVQPHKGIDLVCDIVDLHKHVLPGTCSRIRASHVMEHFPTKQVPILFKMVYSLLQENGVFEVIVPNFEWHARLVMQGQSSEAVTYAYGGQLDEWDFHKTGFTPYILEGRMQEAGFTVEDLRNQTSLTCIGRKLRT